MEACRIIAIRHGETAWNAGGRIQGQLDIELNARGRWQAAQVARAIADSAAQQSIDAIYSSDLLRASQTAKPLADALGCSLATDASLRERGFGAFEGQTFEQITARWPDQAERWRQRDPEFAPEGGESLVIFRERVLRSVGALAARHPGQQIAVVSHGGVMDVLYRAATRQELQAFRTWELSNAAINRLLWSAQGFSLVGWADTHHLANEPLDETTA
ncbi:MAG: histidine phosphatase family protein [Burkholderiales bacterium]